MAERYGVEVFNSTVARILYFTVDRYPLYRMREGIHNLGPRIGEPSTILLTCKGFYRSGRRLFFRTVYVDISLIAQYCRIMNNRPDWSVRDVDTILPGIEKLFYDLQANKTRIKRVVLFGDSDYAHERRALWNNSGIDIPFGSLSSALQELCLNINPARNTVDLTKMNNLVNLRIDFRSNFGDPMSEGPLAERPDSDQQGWPLIERCLTLESLRNLELEWLCFPNVPIARTFLSGVSHTTRKRLRFLGLSLYHGHSQVPHSDERSLAFQTVFGRLLQSIDSLERFFYEGSLFDAQISSSLVAALSYHKHSLQQVVISSSQNARWFDVTDVQYLREFTVLRELAIPVDYINDGMSTDFFDWTQSPLPPNLDVLQLQYGYVMPGEVELHQTATEYMDILLHDEDRPNVASALPSLKKVYWWRSQPWWDLPEMEETTAVLKRRISQCQNVHDPAMARIGYRLLEGADLRDTPLGRQLKYWDPLPQTEWCTMV